MHEKDINKIQKLFLKISAIFKQVNLEVYVPSNSSETVQLKMPKELNDKNHQIGSIQFGGIKYPMTKKSHFNLSYVEVRLKGTFLKEIDVYNAVYTLVEQTDANDWIKCKFEYTKEDIMLVRKIARNISKGLEKTYGNKYLTLGMDPSIYELPRQKGTDIS